MSSITSAALHHCATTLAVCTLLLAGCTATQLRYQTLNEAGSVESLTQKQIFYNLRLFDNDEFAIPSQVTVTAGSASTTNSVAPTFMTPLGSATTITSQLANTASTSLASALANTTSNSLAVASNNSSTLTTGSGTSGMTTVTTGSMVAPAGTTLTTQSATQSGSSTSASNAMASGGSSTTTTGATGGTTATNTNGNTNAVTDSSQSTSANRTLSLALSDNWTESWTLDPVTDSDALRRLSALYRFLLGKSSVIDSKSGAGESPEEQAQYIREVDAQFMCDYPLPKQAGASSADDASSSTPKTTVTTKTDPDTGEVQTVTSVGNDAKDDNSVTLVFKCLAGKEHGQQKYKIKTAVVDRSQLRLPECVICIDEDPTHLQLRLFNTMEAVSDALASVDTLIQRLNAHARLEQTTPANKAEADQLSAEIAASKNREDSAKQDAANRQADVKRDEVLIADDGAFASEIDPISTNTTLHKARGTVSPFINPAVIFGLVSWKSKTPLAAPARWKSCRKYFGDGAVIPNVSETSVDLGSYEFRHLYARCDKDMDPREAFHEFELLVTSAAQLGPAAGGAKPVVAIRTGNTLELR
jgi:hypothetical protein